MRSSVILYLYNSTMYPNENDLRAIGRVNPDHRTSNLI